MLFHYKRNCFLEINMLFIDNMSLVNMLYLQIGVCVRHMKLNKFLALNMYYNKFTDLSYYNTANQIELFPRILIFHL